MNHTNLGTSGLRVSRICLGMMGFGNGSDRPWVIDEDAAEPIDNEPGNQNNDHDHEWNPRLFHGVGNWNLHYPITFRSTARPVITSQMLWCTKCLKHTAGPWRGAARKARSEPPQSCFTSRHQSLVLIAIRIRGRYM